MSHLPRPLAAALAGLVVAAVAVAPPASASGANATCTFSKTSRVVTLKLPSADAHEGDYLLSRVPGTQRIGYDTSQIEWKYCGGASIDNTDRIRVIGSQQSETLIVSLEGGAFAPGATRERHGSSEIEITGDLGSGTDRLYLRGGPHADHITILSRTEASLNRDGDADVVLAGVDLWTVYGGPGNDVLNGRGADRVDITGAEGDDKITGSKGRDTLYGDNGATTAIGDDVIVGGDGDDSIYGQEGRDRLVGGRDDDYLVGGEGRDVISGGADDDYVPADSTRDGSDVVSGGSGTDTATYSSRTRKLSISLDGRANDGAKGEHDNVKRDVENVYGGSADDRLIGSNAENSLGGNAGNDYLSGLAGDDTLRGGDGNDRLFGGVGDEYFPAEPGQDLFSGDAGDDTMNAGSGADGRDVYLGGPGTDSIDYGSRTASVTLDVSSDNGDGEAGENDFVHSDFENLTTGSGSDTVVGGRLAERISGNAGNDALSGGRGADRIYGGVGNDTLVGGEGYDSVYGEDGDDTLSITDQAADYADGGYGSDSATVDLSYDTVVNVESVSG